MFSVKCVESYVDSNQFHYGCFIIEPLDSGQGITLGNALRRTLLSELVGSAITAVRINNVKHEFSAINGVREDVLDIILNLKEIRFKNIKYHPMNVRLKVFGPSVATAAALKTPEYLEVVNKNQYIATVNDSAILEMELRVEQGKGYIFANQQSPSDESDFLGEPDHDTVPLDREKEQNHFLLIDAIFSPIKKVNFRIRLLPFSEDSIKESLIFEIWTDGSITPKRSLKEATKFLLHLFYPLLTIN